MLVVLVLAIIWEIALASAILVSSLTSGKWSNVLLGLGLLYTLTVLYRRRLEGQEKRKLRTFGRLVLFIIAILAFQNHGFFGTLYLLATVFIFSRFMNWIAGLFTPRKKRRRDEPFIVTE